jgi:MscS family membrane protein
VREGIQRFQARESPAAVTRATATVLRDLDLSELPRADLVDQGWERALQLLEILERVELPPLAQIPDLAAVEATGLTHWTIPNTEITIARTEDGPHAGEFQFSARTVEQLPAFYERAKSLPYKPGALVGAYEDWLYAPGPWLPLAWTTHLPSFAYAVVLKATIWQWLGTLATLVLTAAVVVLAYRFGRSVDQVAADSGPRRHFGRLMAMIVAVASIALVSRFVDDGINLGGSRLFVLNFALRILQLIAAGWGIILLLNSLAEAIIRSRASLPGSIDAHLIRIVVRLLGIVLLIYLALYLADSYGIPAAPLIASLGVGGLAIALAVRPTLENIIGGFTLFADRPVRVGDFCSFGDHMGTIEEIGLRSTRVRALDRTLISIPNARFADLEIINWAKCDQMLINATIGLRFETTPDQMRYVLAKIREMLHAHPKIDPATIRVRYIGPGASSRDVSVRIYALTREWNEFFAIREDVFLRIDDIVEEAGTGYAFPSQTLYMTRDEGLDRERSEAAVQEVQVWRHSGKLPFPGLAAARMAELEGTLDYPPRGSVDTSSALPAGPEPEPLSTEPLSAETPREPPAAEAQEEGERHR